MPISTIIPADAYALSVFLCPDASPVDMIIASSTYFVIEYSATYDKYKFTIYGGSTVVQYLGSAVAGKWMKVGLMSCLDVNSAWIAEYYADNDIYSTSFTVPLSGTTFNFFVQSGYNSYRGKAKLASIQTTKFCNPYSQRFYPQPDD